MGVELLLFLFLFGPGVILYGLWVTIRQRVRLTRDKVLEGKTATLAGLAIVAVGLGLTFSLWWMAKFLRV